ncbi:MAG: hypothetical protein Q8941_14865 [Bacteroidota bacterium]|nr:hypothetical protein [Bacteroidota bacterium]
MKKIFTLIAASFLTVAVFAADRQPVVTVTAGRNYQVVIDGRNYFSSNSTMSISNLCSGEHSIKVFEISRGFIFRQKRLVSSSCFQLRNNDVDICLDFRGQISISEKRSGWDNGFDRDHDQGWGNGYGRDKDYGRDHDRGHDDNKYDRNRHF